MTDKLYKYILMAITLFCAIFSVIIPTMSIPFSLIGSALFATVVTTNKGPIPILFTAVIFGSALFITGSVTVSFLILLTFLPIGVALGIAMMKKLNLNGTVALSISVSIIFVLIIIFFFVFEYSTKFSLEEAFAPIGASLKSVIAQSYDILVGGMNNTDIIAGRDTFIEGSYQQLILSIPYYITAVLLFIIILSYWLLKFLLKGLSINVSHMGAFTTLTISRTGAVIYFICTLLSIFMSTGVESIVVYNFTSIMTLIFAYAGLSLIAYILNMKSISKIVRIIIYIAIIVICIIPFGFSGLVALVGIADSYYHIRKRMAGGSEYL